MTAYVEENLDGKAIAITENASKLPIKKLIVRDVEALTILVCACAILISTIQKLEVKFIGVARSIVNIIGTMRLTMGPNQFARNVSVSAFVSAHVEPPAMHTTIIKCTYTVFYKDQKNLALGTKKIA